MRKLLLFLAITTAYLLLPPQVNASHVSGMDLTLTNMGGNDYLIRLAFYRDCSGISAPSTVAFTFTCLTNFALNFTLTGIPAVAGSGQQITPVCPTMSTTCNNGILYGIQEYVYEAMVILPPCSEWRVGWSGSAAHLLGLCCRNPSNTVVSPTSNNAYIELRINNLLTTGASTPSFTQIPILALCVNQTNCFNMGAIDPDGDSLSYSMVTPMTDGNFGTLTWIPPSTAQQPFPSNPLITLDPLTGNLCMSPNVNIISPLAIKVEKWRHISGVPTLIGTIYRDIQIHTGACNNQLPMLTGMDTTMTNGFNFNDTLFHMILCVGDTVKFTMWGHDPDTANPLFGDRHLFSIQWNNGIPQGNFQALYNNTDSAKATFTWVPGPNDVSTIPHCFTATITDGACPINGVQMYAYCVIVQGFLINVGPDTLACKGESVTFHATTTLNTDTYQWFVNGVATGPPSIQSVFTLNTTNMNPGQYIVAAKAPNQWVPQCPGKGHSMTEVVYMPTPDLGGDQILYTPDPVILDAGPGTLYLWTTSETTQTITVYTSGTYGVEVDGGSGTRCRGFDQVNIEYLIGIEDDVKNHSVEISPNPTTGMLLITTGEAFNHPVLVTLFTPEGKNVLELTVSPDSSPEGTITLDIGHLADGLYILRLNTTEWNLSRKVLLKN